MFISKDVLESSPNGEDVSLKRPRGFASSAVRGGTLETKGSGHIGREINRKSQAEERFQGWTKFIVDVLAGV